MASLKRSQESPTPSITLQITQKTADQFLRTVDALQRDVQKNHRRGPENSEGGEGATGNIPTEQSQPPVFHQVYQAMLASTEEAVVAFRHKLKAASLSANEEKVAALLFYDCATNEKLGHCVKAVRDGKTEAQSRADFASLFQGALAGIMSCCETEKSEFVVEGKPDRAEGPPPKRLKTEDVTESTKLSTVEITTEGKDIRECQSPSFDSSLATLHDEEYPEGVKKEITEVANYAADQLLKHFEGTPVQDISIQNFEDWYYQSGRMLVPWMELLSVDKWKSASSQTKPPPQEETLGHSDKEDKKEPEICNKENESNDTDGSQEIPRGASDNQDNSRSSGKEDETKGAFVPPRPNLQKPEAAGQDISPGSLIHEESTSRILVSFDFSESGSVTPFCINISEDNLIALRHFVERTGLMHCPAPEICKRLLRLATRRVFGDEALLTLQRDIWLSSIDKLLGRDAWEQLTATERAAFTACMADVFGCYEGSKSFLRSDEVDLQEFAVGFCFFCAGNKSTKLATGFEMLDDKRKSSLSQEELLRYLTSYLTMLVAMSLLKPISQRNVATALSDEKRDKIRQAVESGSRWTLSSFVKHVGENDFEARKDSYSFEKFAAWYSSGGYEVAPWLELLDLSKICSLLASPVALTHPGQKSYPRDRVSSLRRHHSNRRGVLPEALFTFPLANQSSLIVLKEDAFYVRTVVEQLGLLSMSPDDLWAALCAAVERKQRNTSVTGGAIYVGMSTFVEVMENICSQSRPRSNGMNTELLANFFQCFDLDNNNNVALDELMGGLTLLCGGKKSHKLAFAFGVFDTRPGIQEKKRKEGIAHSLSGEDLFLFLRSVLIVTFSCCRQSLDMTDGMVARCIADTANMICNDVMRHQWERCRRERLDFDEFGQWYNDGGYERAPWLELLDLKKWVLVDGTELNHKRPFPPQLRHHPHRHDHSVPPPPPEESLDADFFETSIMPMDSMDEMDMILMQPSHDKETDISSPRIRGSFSFSSMQASPAVPTQPPPARGPAHPLKFHLCTDDEHGGYVFCLSHKRIRHLRRLLEKSSLHKLEPDVVCNKVLSKASKSKNPKLNKESFDAAVSSILSKADEGTIPDPVLVDILRGIFYAFDRERYGKTNAIEIACGFTVLCNGKKSDKLEFAFEVLDKRKKGHLSKTDMTNYLRSFLTVLLSLTFSPYLDADSRTDALKTLKGGDREASPATLSRAADSGAKWAASLAFHSIHHSQDEPSMTFDEFAEWYTSSGYSSIPWLELLDLRKWVFAE